MAGKHTPRNFPPFPLPPLMKYGRRKKGTGNRRTFKNCTACIYRLERTGGKKREGILPGIKFMSPKLFDQLLRTQNVGKSELCTSVLEIGGKEEEALAPGLNEEEEEEDRISLRNDLIGLFSAVTSGHISYTTLP